MVIKILEPVGTQTKGSVIFRGRIVHSKSLEHLEILHDGALGIRSDGTIAFLESRADDVESVRAQFAAEGFDTAKEVQLQPSQFLFPGFVDTHLHAPQWPNLALGMDDTLRDWIEKWTDPVEASYSDTEKAHRVYTDVVATTLRLGSTTVAYNGSIHADATNILADICFNAGQRAIIGKMNVIMGSTKGNWEESPEISLADTEKTIKHILKLDPEGRLIHPCIQPRGGPYCPPDLMAGLGKFREKYNAYVQGHMCETQSDIDRTLELHAPLPSYSDVYAHHSLLPRRAIQAHCIHLQPRDRELLRDTGAGVAHNPNSNTCLRDGICAVRDLLDAGIRVGLGTDCSAGYMPSIHEAMRAASNVSRHRALQTGRDRDVLGFAELVYLATLGGAGVVDLAHRTGNFEPGKEWDALLVDTRDVIGVSAELWGGAGRDEDLLRKWVFLGDDRSIREVYVGGRLVGGWDLRERTAVE